MSTHANNFPKLHNAMWPGLVGKGSPGAEPCIGLDTMLDLTAKAEADGVRFDGVDIFLFAPHIDIDISDDDLKRVAEKIQAKGLVVGSVVAPIWPPTGGGSAMGTDRERKQFVGQVRKGCRIAAKLREIGARPHGVVRVDTACGVTDWDKDPEGSTRLIARTLQEACDVAESFGERLAAEGEICWGGLHSWREAIRLLEMVGRPQTLGFQADMAHTLLYLLGYNKPEDALLAPDWNWSDPAVFDAAYRKLTAALRPWTIDFHIAQNDATVKGGGSHDKTGKHCMATDPNGKLDIAHHAGFWMRDEKGAVTRAFRSVCWDGCLFPNEVMMQQQTWNDILAAMVAVRDAHGWAEDVTEAPKSTTVAEVFARAVKKAARRVPAKPGRKSAKKSARKPVRARSARSTAAKAVRKPITPKTRKPMKSKKPVKKAVKKAVKKPAKKGKK